MLLFRGQQLTDDDLIAFSRPPTDEEMQIGMDALARLAEQWADPQDAIGLKPLTTFCHAIVNSAGFLYVD